MAGEKSKKDLYFQVEGIKYDDVPEMCDHINSLNTKKGLKCFSVHSKIEDISTGRRVIINNKTLALFKYRGLMYALDSQCPHMGGPLYLGDIEEIGEAKIPCIVCPWHHWKYDMESGNIMQPIHEKLKLNVYPVKVMEDGSLFVGFESISSNYFNCGESF